MPTFPARAALALAIALLAAGPLQAQDARAARVAALQQEIWRGSAVVTGEQDKLPVQKRASPRELLRLQEKQRAPAIAALSKFAAAQPRDGATLKALGLIFDFGPADQAAKALDRMVGEWPDDDALAGVLEGAYENSAALGKRTRLAALSSRTKSRAVAGSSLYLMARETLNKPTNAGGRAEALAQLTTVRDRYGDVKTTMMGGGPQGSLGAVATGLIFKTRNLAPGAALPVMAVKDLDGRPATNAAFRGKVTLVAFWATWCPPCISSLPGMRALDRDPAARDFQIVSISGDGSPATAKTFVASHDMPWTQWYVGPSGVISPEWSNTDYPYYLLVGRDGKIVATSLHFDDILPKARAEIARVSPVNSPRG